MSPRGDTEGGGHLQEHHGHQWDQQDQGDQLHPGIKGGKQRKNGIRAVVRRWHREPGHGCPRGMSPPCHQEHQQGQGGRWDRSGLGDRPCQERHQHLWDRGHPEEGGTQGGVTGTGFTSLCIGTFSVHPPWDGLDPLPPLPPPPHKSWDCPQGMGTEVTESIPSPGPASAHPAPRMMIVMMMIRGAQRWWGAGHQGGHQFWGHQGF